MSPANQIEFISPDGIHAPTGYSHVARALSGRPVWIAGQVAVDPVGNVVGADDIEAQARRAFQNLSAALSAVALDAGKAAIL